MKSPRITLLIDLTFGAVVGIVISVLPLPFNVAAIFGLIVAAIIVRKLRPGSVRRSSAFAVGVALLGTIFVTTALPVKQLDKTIPAIQYPPMPLGELCNALAKDYGVFVSPEYEANAQTMIVAFSTDRRMSRRDVLRKLAHDTGTELDIGYCGTGSTFLFGAHPSFTQLRGPGRRPDA